jgi:hypothetical protein
MRLPEGVRSLGVDDGPFERDRRGQVLVVGAVYQGGTWFDGLLTTRVQKDGWNATDRLLGALTGSKFLPQLGYLLLGGIAVGGFNLFDLDRLHAGSGLKLLVVMRRLPDLPAMRRAIERLPRARARLRLLEAAGPIRPVGNLFCQLRGMQPEEAAALLRLTCTRAHLPEPLRVAHLVAGGLARGQSGRRA